MAQFRFKLVGYDPLGGTIGRQYQLNDNAVARVIAAYRSVYSGQVPDGPPDAETGITPMRDRTDAEMVNLIFDRLSDAILLVSYQHARKVAAEAADSGVAPDVADASQDN